MGRKSGKPDGRFTVWGKKSKNLNVRLTEEGHQLAKKRADELGISVSDVMERWARRYDVNFGDAVPIPPSLDSRASVVKSMSGIELHQALGEKLEEHQEKTEIKDRFLQKLAEGNLSEADVAEFAGLMDLDDLQADGLMKIPQLFRRGKKTNGV